MLRIIYIATKNVSSGTTSYKEGDPYIENPCTIFDKGISLDEYALKYNTKEHPWRVDVELSRAAAMEELLLGD